MSVRLCVLPGSDHLLDVMASELWVMLQCFSVFLGICSSQKLRNLTNQLRSLLFFYKYHALTLCLLDYKVWYGMEV